MLFLQTRPQKCMMHTIPWWSPYFIPLFACEHVLSLLTLNAWVGFTRPEVIFENCPPLLISFFPRFIPHHNREKAMDIRNLGGLRQDRGKTVESTMDKVDTLKFFKTVWTLVWRMFSKTYNICRVHLIQYHYQKCRELWMMFHSITLRIWSP